MSILTGHHPKGKFLAFMRSVKSESFAGHRDARASQACSVWIAKAGAPDQFIKIADSKVSSHGRATRRRLPMNETDVVAVRLDFADGPLGIKVYREICLVR